MPREAGRRRESRVEQRREHRIRGGDTRAAVEGERAAACHVRHQPVEHVLRSTGGDRRSMEGQ